MRGLESSTAVSLGCVYISRWPGTSRADLQHRGAGAEDPVCALHVFQRFISDQIYSGRLGWSLRSAASVLRHHIFCFSFVWMDSSSPTPGLFHDMKQSVGKEGWSGGTLQKHVPDPSWSANVDVLRRCNVEATRISWKSFLGAKTDFGSGFLSVQIEGSPGTCYSSFWCTLPGFLPGVTTGWEQGGVDFGVWLAPSCRSMGCSHGAHPVLGVVSAAVSLGGEETTCKQNTKLQQWNVRLVFSHSPPKKKSLKDKD